MRIHWAWPAALLLGVVAIVLLRRGATSDEAEVVDVGGLFDQLERMALVYVSAISESPAGPYFLDRYEVTNAEFARFVDESGYRPTKPAGFLLHLGGADGATRFVPPEKAGHPAVHVSVEDAKAFADWRRKDVPTVAEWMHAARGASAESKYDLNAAETRLATTAAVGTFESGRTRMTSFVEPSVYDLLGNVSEWTSTPARSDQRGGAMIVKGGSFLNSLRRLDHRAVILEEPDNRNFALGFRCVVRDAEGIIRAVLASLASAGAATRAETERKLASFGEPLRRLLARIRFEDRVSWRAGHEMAVQFVRPIEEGRIILCGFDGSLRVVDGESGEVEARRDDLPRLDAAVTADLDHDGHSELYVVTDAEHPGWGVSPERLEVIQAWAQREARLPFNEDATRFEYLFAWRDGRVRLLDPASARAVAWPAGPFEEVERRALDFGREYLPQWVPEPSVFASDPTRYGVIDGYVERVRQRLLRLDPRSGTLATVWSREVHQAEKLVPLEEGGELAVVSELPREFGFPELYESAEPFNRVLDLRVFGLDGTPVSRTFVPGGSASLVPLDSRGERLLIVTHTGYELVLDRSSPTSPFVSLLRPTRGRYFVDRAIAGPNPYAASLMVVELDEKRKARSARLEAFDARGVRVAETSLPVVDGAPPRRYAVRGSAMTLLLLPDATLVALSPEFEELWRRDDVADVALDRASPALVDFDRDGDVELCVPWRLDGFLRLDPTTGETIDGYRNPNALVLDLRGHEVGGEDVLLATFADLGVLAFRPIESVIDDEARRLIAELESR